MCKTARAKWAGAKWNLSLPNGETPPNLLGLVCPATSKVARIDVFRQPPNSPGLMCPGSSKTNTSKVVSIVRVIDRRLLTRESPKSRGKKCDRKKLRLHSAREREGNFEEGKSAGFDRLLVKRLVAYEINTFYHKIVWILVSMTLFHECFFSY